jgi:tetratricopeptide (TPR) repeat protein
MQGAAQRQLGELFEARRCYQLAIMLIHNRMEAEQAQTPVSAEGAVGPLSEVEILSLYELGKCFLHGFCATRYISGLLVQAQADVSAALVMLRRNGDVMTRAYAQLLEATITRCSAGADPEKLTAALEMVDAPRSVFSEHGHERYLSRCDYESALGYLYLGRAQEQAGDGQAADRALKEARLAVTRVAEFSERTGDADWRCIAATVLSRIARSQGAFEESREAADRALAAAAGGSGKVSIDARVAKGASLLDGEISARDIEDAIGHFEEALKLATNPKATGNCYLHLADANLRRNELAQAKGQFGRWLSVRKEVQHASVHAFADRVEAQLGEREKDLFAVSAGDSLIHEHQETRLRRFLIDQAEKITSSPDEQAELLGVTRATLYNWKNKLAGASG